MQYKIYTKSTAKLNAEVLAELTQSDPELQQAQAKIHEYTLESESNRGTGNGPDNKDSKEDSAK